MSPPKYGASMRLSGPEIRAAYYVASEVIRSRQRNGQPIPAWMRRHFNQLDTAVRVSRPRHDEREIGGREEQSRHANAIGAREAAEILKLSPRQVQRRASELGGQMVCGRLLFMRDTVVDYAQRRDDA